MAITVQAYTQTPRLLFQNPFADESSIYAAQLVSSAYIFSATHTTRANFAGFTVSTPIRLAGKTVVRASGVLTFDCDDLTFPTLDAAYCIIHLMNTGSPQGTDRLVMCFDLNDGATESLSSPIEINESGLIKITVT
jgi:hypothetical protein